MSASKFLVLITTAAIAVLTVIACYELRSSLEQTDLQQHSLIIEKLLKFKL